ncbi:Imm6 family immunity protein [Neobacillus mesonae]|nr:Imm6 family immunity protein [Neobacillus mesonae]
MADIKFDSLSDDNKVIFLLTLSEKALDVFSRKEDSDVASDALDKCWNWLRDKDPVGDALYDLLDNEDSRITIIQEMSDNEADVDAWNCIIDAVAFTSRKALEKEGVRYYPEPIALVDDTIADHFIECFEKIVDQAELHINKSFAKLNE